MFEFFQKRFYVLVLILGIFFIDQFTKLLIDRYFVLYETAPVIRGFFNLTYIRNTGMIFGFFPGAGNIVLWLSLLSLGLLAFYFFLTHHPSRWMNTAFGFVLGGALGNTWDRVSRGYVIDFVDIYYGRYHFPTFNVADACITIGVLMLIMHLLGEQWRGEPYEMPLEHMKVSHEEESSIKGSLPEENRPQKDTPQTREDET